MTFTKTVKFDKIENFEYTINNSQGLLTDCIEEFEIYQVPNEDGNAVTLGDKINPKNDI